MDLSPAELSLIEDRVAHKAPRTAVAYLLWLFLGWASAHRFYLGRPRTAVLQILSYLLLVGVLWWLLDGFNLPRMIAGKKSGLRVSARAELARSTAAGEPAAADPELRKAG
jgi:TM2 domain-containing membrane protein YozV